MPCYKSGHLLKLAVALSLKPDYFDDLMKTDKEMHAGTSLM